MLDYHRTPFALWMRRVVVAILLVPSAWLLAFGSLVVRARIVVGEWPHPRGGNPFDGTEVDTSIDPKDLGWLHDAVWWGAAVTAWAIELAILALIVGIFWRPLRAPILARTVFAVSTLACIALVGLDLGEFVSWFLD